MKIKKYLVVFLISLFCFCNVVNAESSNFEPFLTMATDITENQIKIALGFEGEEIMTIKETLTYDSNKLTLVEVQALDNFTVTTSPEKKDGKYRTVDILADSDYSFSESNYAILIFEVKGSFKKKNKSDIFLYDYTASGPEKIKYRSKGFISTLNRVSLSEMNFVLENITSSTKTKYWIINHIYIFVIIAFIIVGAVVTILLLPSKRKNEVREKSTEDLLKPENYDPSSSNIKIDREAIDAIGKVEKPIDMTQAIIVDENVKPFGDVTSRFDNNANTQQVQNNTSTSADNTPLQNNAPVQVTGEHVDMGTSVNGFDPFNATVMPELKENTNQTIETLEDMVETLPDDVQSTPVVNNPNEELTVINPQTFENVELPKLNEDVNIGVGNNISSDTNNNSNNQNGNNVLSILFALLAVTSLCSVAVKAEESKYQVSSLRDCIVGRISFDKQLDYNNDGVVDVLDIIETKDLSNCSFENLLSTDPGFAEVHGKSNNLISTDSEYVAPTKKTKLIGGDKTTTKKTTTKQSSGGSSSGGAKTTTSRTTKEKVTNSTTTRAGATRATTTKASTQKYSVTINGTNGSASPNSFELETGKSKSVTLSANSGFVIDTASSSCSNVSYSFNGTTSMVLSNITNNATCTLKFVSKGNVKVTLTYFTGKGKSETTTPTYTYTSKTISNDGKGSYGQTWSTGVPLPSGYKLKEAPTCGNYNAGTYSIVIPATSITCKMYFDPILYDFKVSLAGQAGQINGGTLARIFYGEKKKIEFEANTLYSTASCTGGGSIKLTKTGRGPYHYSFYYTHNTASNAVCNVS